MTIKNADMPAMPTYQYDKVGDVTASELVAAGLTKREMMAMHIMSGLLSDPKLTGSGESFAVAAVSYTDALLAELERIAAGDSVPDELLSTIDLIAVTMQGLKGEDAND